MYEIKVAGRQVLLRVLPPEGGAKANLADLQRDLKRREIDFRHETLFDIYRQSTGEFELIAIREAKDWQVEIEVSEDGLEAHMTTTAPEVGDSALSPDEVRKAMEEAKLLKGINYQDVRRILANAKGVQHVLIAQGKPRVQGVDGRITFEQRSQESGVVDVNTADYRELNLIDNIKKDELIASITLPTPGESGFNVHSQVLPARPGKRAKFKLGRSVRLSEDGTELFASRDGFIVRTGQRISVEHILKVNNVDGETGNIRFHGVVQVLGQVEDNFSVDADKGIEIGGTVGKARLRSKGDIRIRGGTYGAEIDCEGHMQARFVSESKVNAGGNVTVDEYILHSEVVAKGAVRVTHSTKGFIQGGRTRAESEIITAIAGSEASEAHTALEVGGGVNVRKAYDALQERMAMSLERFAKLRLNLVYMQRERESKGPLEGRQVESFESLISGGQKLANELLTQTRRHHELGRALGEPEVETGFVLISEAAHPGTTIQIQTGRVVLRDPMDACGFAYLSGSVKAMPYGTALNLHKQEKAKRDKRAKADAAR